MFETHLYAHLVASPLNALLAGRIYPDFVPEPVVRPYMTYAIVFQAPVYSMKAQGVNRESMAEKRFVQFDIWADTAFVAKTVEEALRGVLSGYSGTMNGALNVRACFKSNEISGIESAADGKNDSIYRITTDYSFFSNK